MKPFFTSGQQGIPGLTMLTPNYDIDSEKTLVATEVVYPGRALTFNGSGNLVVADDTSTFIYGLTDTNQNPYVNETNDPTGAFGSGQANVYIRGRAVLRQNVYYPVGGSPVTVDSYDTLNTALTNYVPGTALVVETTTTDATNPAGVKGRISIAGVLNPGTTKVGYVLTTPTAANGYEMQIFISTI